MLHIFISYRRADSRADTGRLYDRLVRHFGDDRVFMDIDDITPGSDFVQALHASLDRCDTMLAVIGPHWLAAPGGVGKSRLDERDDVVRMEILRAIERGVRIIPVLVGDARMPVASSLPAALAPLVRCQAAQLSDAQFHRDVDLLIATLEDGSGGARSRRRRPGARKLVGLGVLAIAVATIGLTWQQLHKRGAEVSRQLTAADALSANGDFQRADAAYRRVLAARPDSAAAYRRIVSNARERFLREGLGSTGHTSIAPGRNALRLAPIDSAQRSQAASDLQALYALDPASRSDVDVLLDEALILKAGMVGIRDALPILERAHALAPTRADVLAELGLLQAVVNDDPTGIERVRQAVALAPDSARFAFYLGQALASRAQCTGSDESPPPSDRAVQCADAVRSYRHAYDLATGDDYWASHLRRHAVRQSMDIFHRYAREAGDMAAANLALSVPERIDAIEFLRTRESSVSRAGWFDYPEYWLALLYEANGQPDKARTLLETLFAAHGHHAKEWVAAYERLGAGDQ